MNRIIAIAVLMFGLAAPAWAGCDEGEAAYKRGDYAMAFREIRPVAEQGDASLSNMTLSMDDQKYSILKQRERKMGEFIQC